MRSTAQRVVFRERATSAPAKRRRQPSKRIAPGTGRRTPSVSPHSATVLVVDDDSSVLSALARLIRAAGFLVRTFDRPSALLASEMPITNACMLVDVHLPEMSGIDLCKALAASGRNLPAIMITGRTDTETLRLLEHVRPGMVLFKPVDELVLLEAIERAVTLSKSEGSGR